MPLSGRIINPLILVLAQYIIRFTILCLSYAIDYPEDDDETRVSRSVDHHTDPCRNVTTQNATDLNLSGLPIPQASQVLARHGTGVLPALLSHNTTQSLRQLFQRWNAEKPGRDFLIPNGEQRARHHVSVHDADPVFAPAWHEIGSHGSLRGILDRIVGANAALVGAYALTIRPGAVKQKIHMDGDFAHSYRNNPTLFFQGYSVVIALQNTTKSMGATYVCPGTQHCLYKPLSGFGDSNGCFQVPVSAGDAILFNRDMQHGGGAHVGRPGEPERIFLFLVFYPSPNSKGGPLQAVENGILPVRTWQLRFRMWGHTIDDFTTMDSLPWTAWDAFGLSYPWRGANHGYSLVYYVFTRLAAGFDVSVPWWKNSRGKPVKIYWSHVETLWRYGLAISVIFTTLWWIARRQILKCHKPTGNTCPHHSTVSSTKKDA